MDSSSKVFLTDQQVVEAIRSGGLKKERAARFLYHQLEGYVIKGKNKYGLNESQAKEAFHIALQRLIQAIEWRQFEGRSKISTYFHPIFFHRCVDILRRDTSHQEMELEDYMWDLPDKAYDIVLEIQAEEESQNLHRFMEMLGEKCKKLLIETEWNGKSLKEVAQEMNYSSASVAGSTKNRCMEKLRKLMNTKRDSQS
ncbi:MAG: sigma-70 family RNA polymerase sigma factor [Bacteroidota bacterium]